MPVYCYSIACLFVLLDKADLLELLEEVREEGVAGLKREGDRDLVHRQRLSEVGAQFVHEFRVGQHGVDVHAPLGDGAEVLLLLLNSLELSFDEESLQDLTDKVGERLLEDRHHLVVRVVGEGGIGV